MNRLKIVVACLPLLLMVGTLWAQSESTVNQGTPGVRGPWPVTGTLTVSPQDGSVSTVAPKDGSVWTVAPSDGAVWVVAPADASVWNTAELACVSSAETTCLITDKADGGDLCPPTQLANRRYVSYCSKTQNATGAIVAISVNGVPNVGIAGTGTSLSVDRCVSFAEPSTKTPHLISNFTADAAVAVSVYECARP
jgi:hypothetical protein